MLSLYKLYKHDMQHKHKLAITDGPHGRPYKRLQKGPPTRFGPNKGKSTLYKDKGSPCYGSCKIDWAAHRAIPAVMRAEQSHKHHPFTKTVQKLSTKLGWSEGDAAQRNLVQTSPRWGPGVAPSRSVAPGRRVPRHTIGLPRSRDIQVSHHTKVGVGVGVGAVAVAGAGYYAYKHRGQIKQRVHRIENSFHHSHLAHTMHLT